MFVFPIHHYESQIFKRIKKGVLSLKKDFKSSVPLNLSWLYYQITTMNQRYLKEKNCDFSLWKRYLFLFYYPFKLVTCPIYNR